MKKTSKKLIRKNKRRQKAQDSTSLLGSSSTERVYTDSFRTKQSFGAASEVKKIKITDELRAKYEKKQS